MALVFKVWVLGHHHGVLYHLKSAFKRHMGVLSWLSIQTLGFGRGHDLRLVGLSPAWGSTLSTELA